MGDQMAQSLLNASPDTQASIQSLYGQISSTSQTGLDALATQMNSGAQLATQKLMDQYAQVDVTLQQELAKNSKSLQDALTNENETYAKALDTATAAHTKAAEEANTVLNKALTQAQADLVAAQGKADKALADGAGAAQDTLTKALADSQKTYDTAIKAISDSTDKQLTALMTKIDAAAQKIRDLGGVASGIGVTTELTKGQMGMYVPGAPVPSSGSSGQAPGYDPAMAAAMKPVYGVYAPITVDGSTAPTDIQTALVSISKYGLVGM